MISGLSVDKMWANRGNTYLEHGQGCQDFRLMFTFFLLQQKYGSPPQKVGNNLVGNKSMHGMMNMFALINSHADGPTKK